MRASLTKTWPGVGGQERNILNQCIYKISGLGRVQKQIKLHLWSAPFPSSVNEEDKARI